MSIFRDQFKIRGLFFLLLICTSASTLHGQEGSKLNDRANRKIGIGLNLLGPTFGTSIQGDYFLTRNLNIEIGGGVIGYYGGAKWYFRRQDRSNSWSPYIGWHHTECFDLYWGWIIRGSYFPVGIQYLSKSGFTLSVELAALNPGLQKDATVPFFGGLKIGYHFKARNQ